MLACAIIYCWCRGSPGLTGLWRGIGGHHTDRAVTDLCRARTEAIHV